MSVQWIEFPDAMVYHIAIAAQKGLRPLCSSYAPYGPNFDAYMVEERSEGRRMCKQCYKRCFQQARSGRIKLPPRTAWEREHWAPQP